MTTDTTQTTTTLAAAGEYLSLRETRATMDDATRGMHRALVLFCGFNTSEVLEKMSDRGSFCVYTDCSL